MTTSSTTGRRRLAVAGLVLLPLLASCGFAGAGTPASPTARGTTVPSSATVVSPARLVPGQSVPAPTGSPLLRVTGGIGTTNAASALDLDMAILDRLGVTRVRLFEPWEHRTMEFRGVWLQDLLAVADVPASAQGLRFTALDDYQVDLSMREVRAGGVFLATRTGDGRPIAVDDGGPTRIVFTDGVASGRSADQWIWSLKTLDVR